MTDIIMLDIGRLHAAYQAGKDAFDHPIAASGIEVDDEPLVVVLMHPAAYEKHLSGLPVDPRSTWNGKDD